MKKVNKQRLLNLVVVTSTILPITFFSLNLKEKEYLKNYLLNNLQTKSIIQDVNDDSSINLNKTFNVYRTPNSLESYPKGYISFSSDRNLFAFDENQNIIWTSPISEDYDVVAIEYNPSNDDLIVLISSRLYASKEATKDFNLKYLVYKKVSEKIEKIINPDINETIRENSSNLFKIYSSWGISPIYEKNGSTSKYVVYNKYYDSSVNGTTSYSIYVIDSNNNYKFKTENLSFGSNWANERLVYSIGAFSNGEQINYIIPFVSKINSNPTSSEKIKIAHFQNNSLIKTIETSMISNALSLNFDTLEKYMKTRLADATISDTGIVFDQVSRKINLFFVLNIKSENNQLNSILSDAMLLKLSFEVSSNNDIKILENEYIAYPFWSYNNNDKNQVTYGYFDNNVIKNKGWGSSSKSSLFVLGSSINNVDKNKSKRIAAIKLENLNLSRTNSSNIYNSDLYINNETKNSNLMKLLFMEKNKIWNENQSIYYSDIYKENSQEGVDSENNLRYLYDYGMIINSYNSEEVDPFKGNIIFTKWNTSKYSIFNLSSNENNRYATYGYKTEYTGAKIDKTNLLNWGDKNINLEDISISFLESYLELGNNINSKYISQLSLKNLPNDFSQYKFKLSNLELLSSDENEGINFDILKVSLYSTFIYNENGVILNIESSTFDNLSTSEKEKFKLLDLYIKGFNPKIIYSRPLIVPEKSINNFISSSPLSGNTKYIFISKEIENYLIDEIVLNNKDNKIENIDIPRPYIEYKLDDLDSDWLESDKFKEFLEASTKNYETNKIYFRLKIDSKISQTGEPYYSIDETPKVLYEKNLTSEAPIKLFINDNYENQLAEIKINGTTKNINYNYGNLPIDSNGNWKGNENLKIQWTTSKEATYYDSYDDSKWSNEQITKIDNINNFLAIRIISIEPYVYSAEYDYTAKVHVLDTSILTKVINLSLDLLEKEIIPSGKSHNIDIVDLKKLEQKVKNNIINSEEAKLEIVYKIYIDNILLTQDWITSNEINDHLLNYYNNKNNSSKGIIQFYNNSLNSVGFAKIVATFKINNQDYIIENESSELIEQGIDLNSNKITTDINLRNWVNILKEYSTFLRKSSINSNIVELTPPGMTTVDENEFLFGMSFNQIEEFLNKIGIIIQFQAPGSETGNEWVSKSQLINLNESNELNLRFYVNNLDYLWRINIFVDDSNIPQDNSNPRYIKLNVSTINNFIMQIDTLDLLNLSFEGNTKEISNIEEIKHNESEIAYKIKNQNHSDDEKINSLIQNSKIIFEYSINNIPLLDENIEKTWFTIDEINSILLKNSKTINSNRVIVRIVLENSVDYENMISLSLSEEGPFEINQESYNENAKFKIYVNSNEFLNVDWIKDNLIVSGTLNEYEISNLDKFLSSLPEGIEIQYNSIGVEDLENIFVPDENEWSSIFNYKPISSSKKYWIRFVAKPGFVFEENQNLVLQSTPIELKIVFNQEHSSSQKKNFNFWWILIIIFSILTLGIFLIFYIFRKKIFRRRNK